MNRKKPGQGKDVQEKTTQEEKTQERNVQKKRTQEENDTHSKLLNRQPEQQDPSNERDIMFWISDLPDSYILEADQAGKGKKRKGGKRMQKILWTGVGVSAAAVIGTIGLFGTGKLHLNHVAKTPAQLEKTTLEENGTQSQPETMPEEAEMMLTTEEETTAFESAGISNPLVIGVETQSEDFSHPEKSSVNWETAQENPTEYSIEYRTTEYETVEDVSIDYRTAENVTVEEGTMDPLAIQTPDKKDSQTEVVIGSLDAYYGVIAEINANSICVQGLEDNDENHRGLIEYSKDDIAVVSGWIGDESCTSVDDLQVGDRVCMIENGDGSSVEGADKVNFQGVAKVIIISRDEVNGDKTISTQQELLEEAVYYARKLGKKASDTEYFKNMQLSDELMNYVQKATGLFDAKPTGAMQIDLSSLGTYLVENELETKFTVTDEINNMMASSLATMLLGSTNDVTALAGYSVLSDNQYLNMEIQTTTALWLYYGDDLPSVMCVFIPRSGGTEIKVNALDADSYQSVYDQMNVTSENDQSTNLTQYLAQLAVIYNDLDTFDYSYLDNITDDASLTEGLALTTVADTSADKDYFNALLGEIVETSVTGKSWDTLADLFTSSDEVNTYVKQAQERLEQIVQGSAKGTLQVYQVPSDSSFSAGQVISMIGNGYGGNQLAANSVVSKIVHERLAMLPITKDWKQDVVLKYSLSDVTLLVSVQKADNLYLQINVNFIWHEDTYNETDLTDAMALAGLVEITD